MSVIDAKLQAQFETLPIELKNAVLERNVELHTMKDLMRVLEQIVEEGEQ